MAIKFDNRSNKFSAHLDGSSYAVRNLSSSAKQMLKAFALKLDSVWQESLRFYNSEAASALTPSDKLQLQKHLEAATRIINAAYQRT